MIELKYVGAKPHVSQHGVSFDQTKPDRYTFLHSALDLLESLSFDKSDGRDVYFYHPDAKEYSSSELMALVQKYCPDMETITNEREEKTTAMINDYVKKVKKNDRLNVDERKAWLGNIEIMRDYYLQYVTNEYVYTCLLQALADKIHDSDIETITFPLGRNYGLVLGHLIDVLRDHTPPYDATLLFIEKDGKTVGKLDLNRHKRLSNL